MTKALMKRRNSLPAKTSLGSGLGLIVVLIAVGLVIWVVLRNRKTTTQYNNLETWEIKRNSQGFATEIIVHRDTRTS